MKNYFKSVGKDVVSFLNQHLLQAVEENKYYSAKVALMLGADPNTKLIHSPDDISHPFHMPVITIATSNINDNIINLLLSYRADIDAPDIKGDTALHVAAHTLLATYGVSIRGITVTDETNSILKILLDNGANPNIENKENKKPLHYINGKLAETYKKEDDVSPNGPTKSTRAKNAAPPSFKIWCCY
ncbi:MAG: hypothetical protein ACK4OM_01220 [Alphaproteobacteria bacterium]